MKRLALVLASMLLGSGAFLLAPSAPASANPQAVDDWSFYEYGNSWNNMYTLGCNQVQYDNYVDRNSFVILDFGGIYDDSGDQENFGGQVLSAYRVYQLATAFAYGYTQCRGANAVYDALAVGTNNSIGLDNAKGSSFATTVKDVGSWVSSYGYHIGVWGANDIESWSGSAAPSQTYNWYYGWAGAGGPSFVNYGSADGCPTGGFGPWCSYGWQQGDYYNLSWGFTDAYSVPEIYTTNASQAEEWYWIGEYGSGVHGMINPWGPLDDYALDPSSNTPTQAWNQLTWFFCPAGGCILEYYAFEMHITT
jgi:hypothetical protein